MLLLLLLVMMLAIGLSVRLLRLANVWLLRQWRPSHSWHRWFRELWLRWRRCWLRGFVQVGPLALLRLVSTRKGEALFVELSHIERGKLEAPPKVFFARWRAAECRKTVAAASVLR